MKFIVTIVETVASKVEIEASSAEEAEEIVRNGEFSGEKVIDRIADDVKVSPCE